MEGLRMADHPVDQHSQREALARLAACLTQHAVQRGRMAVPNRPTQVMATDERGGGHEF